jgi:hypothetical protein
MTVIFIEVHWLLILSFIVCLCVLQMHCTENSKKIFPEMKLCGLVPKFYLHVSVNYLYIPMIGLQTQYSKIGRPIVWIYKSLKDTWKQKLGTAAEFHFWECLFQIFGAVCEYVTSSPLHPCNLVLIMANRFQIILFPSRWPGFDPGLSATCKLYST